MFRFNLCLLASVFVTFAAGAQQPEQPSVVDPYIAYVATPEAFVRCGPNDEYYRTDKLLPGEALEVYVETDDGWLGVRPPESSYSWIPAAHVQLSSDGASGVVEHDKAVAWVGSNLGTARQYRWQVRLQPGEEVAVLESVQRSTATGEKETWLKIVPPPGEFRWIHLQDIAKSPVEAQERIAKLMPRPVRGAREIEKERALALAEENEVWEPVAPVAVATASPVRDPSVRQATMIDEAPVGTGVAPLNSEVAVTGSVRVRNIESSRIQQASATQRAAGDDTWQIAQADGGATAGSTPVDSEQVKQADLDTLQLMLAKQIAAGATADAVDPLRQRANYWIDAGADAVQRGRARLFAERIERYQQVARTRDLPASSTASQAAVAGTTADPHRPYDQQGILVQVFSARPDSPPFALQDRSGRMLAYVAPAPGVNLRRYLKEEVGLYGTTGYLTGLETPYLRVERVVRLDDASLRR